MWTSEAVGPGHPDKVADQISDAILDAYLEGDNKSRVACETMVKGNNVILAGEITSKIKVDIDAVVRETIKDIGYKSGTWLGDNGFNDNCKITNLLTEQSQQISKAVDGDKSTGAGDQGIMFGYAIRDFLYNMPLELMMARGLIDDIQNCSEELVANRIGPDCKAQVTMLKRNHFDIVRADTVVLSVHHHADLIDNWKEFTILCQRIVRERLSYLVTKETKVLINRGGPWTFGGPAADAGLTGRKIVCDNYGADCQIGGGAFSGKDPTKVDRSGSYAARHIAKTLVRHGLAHMCTVQLAYAIGQSEPVSVYVDSHGTYREDLRDNTLSDIVKANWDLTPDGIRDRFQLNKPIFRATANLGHFGFVGSAETENGNSGWMWEEVDSKFLDKV
jgi:S-adenosylmethionine synthetase